MGDINKIIRKLFSERWTDNLANADIEAQRSQLHKTLRNQKDGYWSGHTAYHLAVDGGFFWCVEANVVFLYFRLYSKGKTRGSIGAFLDY